jgi:hypothetical protein
MSHGQVCERLGWGPKPNSCGSDRVENCRARRWVYAALPRRVGEVFHSTASSSTIGGRTCYFRLIANQKRPGCRINVLHHLVGSFHPGHREVNTAPEWRDVERPEGKMSRRQRRRPGHAMPFAPAPTSKLVRPRPADGPRRYALPEQNRKRRSPVYFPTSSPSPRGYLQNKTKFGSSGVLGGLEPIFH